MDMDTENSTNYTQMENILQKINSKYISLPDDEKKKNTQILEQITDVITSKMKEKDTMFRNMYERKFYGGSYYDGLKVGKPEEYDLDFVFKLPSEALPSVEVSDEHGFIHILINDYVKFSKSNQAKKFEKLDTFLEETNSKYLSTSKLLIWFESVMTKALKEMKNEEGNLIFNVKLKDGVIEEVYGTHSKAFPAFTLKLKNDSGVKLDIDLVPCFQFTESCWPKGDYKNNPCPSRNKFLVVPKKPHDTSIENIDRYWRLSFQEQERELMKGNEFNSMKGVIRLLKKLRDVNNHKIASYYIKTIFLWQVEDKPKSFWCQPLSTVFMEMLRRYEGILRDKCIPYYWNEKYNLIKHLKEATVSDIANFLKNVIDNVNKKLDDPFTIAKYMLTDAEIESLRTEMIPIGKKNRNKFKLSGSMPSVNQDEPDTAPVSASTPEERGVNDLLVSLNSKFDFLSSKLDGINFLMKEKNTENLEECDDNQRMPNNLFGLVKSIDRKFDVLSTKIDENHQLMEKKNELLADRHAKLSEKVANLERKMQILTRNEELEESLVLSRYCCEGRGVMCLRD